MELVNVDKQEREKGIRRTLIVLVLTALCFYGGFILMAALRS